MRPLNSSSLSDATAGAAGHGVHGTRCPRGHVNPSAARYCRLCGVAVAGGPGIGGRTAVGALVRGDGVRVLLLEEVALSACPPPPVPSLPESSAVVTARIVFLGWDPFALAETPGVRWCGPDAAPVPLEPGDSAPLQPGAQLVIGLDTYTYEAIEHPAEPTRRRRRPRRLPDRALFD